MPTEEDIRAHGPRPSGSRGTTRLLAHLIKTFGKSHTRILNRPVLPLAVGPTNHALVPANEPDSS
jgi:hypothetical protein